MGSSSRLLLACLCAALLLPALPAAAPASAQSSGASLAGTVVDSNGDPVMNICVVVWDDRPLEHEPVGDAITDEWGEYQVDGLPAGDVKVFYFDCDPEPIYEYQWWNDEDTFTAADAIDLTADSLHTGYDVVLDIGSVVSGRTRDAATGSALEGICVGLFDPDLLLVDVVVTDEDGQYALLALRANEYRIVFVDCNDEPSYAVQWWAGRLTLEAADVLALPARTHAAGADGSLSVAGSLSGRVTRRADGSGAGEVCVGVVDDEAGMIAADVSEDDGTYVVDGVSPGTYAVVFVDCADVQRYEVRYHDDATAPEDASPVTIESGATTSGIDAALPDLRHQGVDPDDPATWPEPPLVMRWAGATRFETAARISEESFEPGVPVAFVATGSNFPDALAGGPVAARQGGPVLLVTRDMIPEATAAELQRVQPEEIVVLGGSGVVSRDVEGELAGYARGSVTRLAGGDRYETAATMSEAEFAPGVPVAYIATGVAFPDALSGGAAAAFRGGPILLTARNQLPSATAAELERIAPSEIIVLGGTAAVSDAVVAQLSAYTSQPVERIGGSDRFDTAARIAAETFPDAEAVLVATGANFPDALAGVPAAGLAAAPLLLATRDTIPELTAEQLTRFAPLQIVVLGGTSVISEHVEEELARYVAGTAGAEGQTESQEMSGPPPRDASSGTDIQAAIEMTPLEWPADTSRDRPSEVSAGPATPLLRSAVGAESIASSGFSHHVDDVTATTEPAELASHTRAWIDRAAIVDLQCRKPGATRYVEARPPTIFGPREGQWVWWRQDIYQHDGRSWRRLAMGPNHFAGVTAYGGIYSRRTSSGLWINHDTMQYVNPVHGVGWTVQSPGWYMIIDNIYFDGHWQRSLARDRQARLPFCRHY